MTTPSTDQTFMIKGMDCAGCARTIETGVAQLAGVDRCELSFTTERLRVQGSVSSATVVARIRDLGYQVAEPADHTTEQSSLAGLETREDRLPDVPRQPTRLLRFLWERRETRMALLGALLILPGLILHEILQLDVAWVDLLSLAALLLAGLPVARSAWRAITITRELNINVLMTIAAIGAVVIGAITEAGMVMVLFAIGEALEGYTATRARQAMRSLLEVVPASAVKISTTCCGDRSEARVPVGTLQVGDLVVVHPGERIPIDGAVRSGYSAVNQAPITGESRLIEKAPGDELFAGSINGEGALEVEVARPADDSLISRMVALVSEAQERRAPVERVIDRFARWYTPAVVAIALLVAVIPPLLLAQPFWNPADGSFGWLYRALALLVVACPCALVISTPASIVSALSAAARRGVLIKGGTAIESLSRIQAIAFDKTGTLTRGQPAVVAVRSVGCHNPSDAADQCDACDELLALAHAVERRSEHPLAHAIVSAGSDRGLAARYPAAERVTALVGQGVSGMVGDREVLVASHRHFDSAIPHAPNHCHAASSDAAQGCTPVLVSAAGSYQGTITVADTLRATSADAIAELRQLGLRRIVMLTGDERAAAERLATSIGISDVRAELLPAQKVAAVEAIRAEHGMVAMVGDGINDTPALAAASVGVAISGAHGGTNQAMEIADVTLLSDDLRTLPFAIRLSREALRTVRWNIAFSIATKLVFLVLVLLGMGTLWMAVLADVGTSLLVTLHGMRLLRYGRGA